MHNAEEYRAGADGDFIVLTEAELAHRWHRSRRTMQRWRRLGYAPPFMRIGGSVFYRMKDVLAFEAARLTIGRAGE
jgi:hypothetical protein